MSNNTILGALDRMGYSGRMTGHGFRGIASTLLHEQGWPHEHIELQLAHQERNQVSASYNHAMYLQPRAQMMQAWSNYLDACVAGNVVPFRGKRA
jgi:integrase